VWRLKNVESTSSRALHIDEPGVVDVASFSSSETKSRPSGWSYANSISEIYEDVIVASINGTVDDRVWRDLKMKLPKCSFRRWVLKDKLNSGRKLSALEVESITLDE
jgi:hypothetical protein